MNLEKLNACMFKDGEPAICSICGETAELRPYGKDGAWICYSCMMEDKDLQKNAEQIITDFVTAIINS
jgi:hypothetical protein